MPRLKYTSTDQRLAASRAHKERERQRRFLSTLCQKLVEQRPDVVGFVEAFWESRRLYLEMERHLESLLWNNGIFKHPLLLDSNLTSKNGGHSNEQPTSSPTPTTETGDSPTVPDSGV